MDYTNITTRPKLFTALHEQYVKKNAAYGNSAHKTFEAWGETAYLVRISDKINRMNQLLLAPKTDDIGESILDTIGDCITYLIMLLADCKARDYAVNGKTYESAIEDEFTRFTEWKFTHDEFLHAMEGLVHIPSNITIEYLRDTWDRSDLNNDYYPARLLVMALACICLYMMGNKEGALSDSVG